MAVESARCWLAPAGVHSTTVQAAALSDQISTVHDSGDEIMALIGRRVGLFLSFELVFGGDFRFKGLFYVWLSSVSAALD